MTIQSCDEKKADSRVRTEVSIEFARTGGILALVGVFQISSGVENLWYWVTDCC